MTRIIRKNLKPGKKRKPSGISKEKAAENRIAQKIIKASIQVCKTLDKLAG
jgi:hypothetical protein